MYVHVWNRKVAVKDANGTLTSTPQRNGLSLLWPRSKWCLLFWNIVCLLWMDILLLRLQNLISDTVCDNTSHLQLFVFTKEFMQYLCCSYQSYWIFSLNTFNPFAFRNHWIIKILRDVTKMLLIDNQYFWDVLKINSSTWRW